MQKALYQQSEQPAISLNDFLSTLFQTLEKERIRFCVLRNYEGFPVNNLGHDIDFLINLPELPRAIRAIRSIQGIRIVGYTKRPYVANVFVSNVSPTPKARALQIDLDLSLTWKGLPYLSTEEVLKATIERKAGDLTFFVPSPTHEAIISLFASLLVGGWLKEKYFPKVQKTFAEGRSDMIAALLPRFGLKTSTRLVNSTIAGERQNILGCIRPLRISLALRSLLRRPLCSILAVIRHYARECYFRYLPQTLETVCILEMGGCGTTKCIDGLIEMLKSSAVVVEKCHFHPRTHSFRTSSKSNLTANCSTRMRQGSLVSSAMVVWWLAEEWIGRFREKRNLTLRICSSCYYDLLINKRKKNRYGLPRWFARIVRALFPSFDFWILLDHTEEEMQFRDQRLSPAETLRQLEAYRIFVKTKKQYIILDASKPFTEVTEDAYAAIIEMLAQLASRQLNSAD